MANAHDITGKRYGMLVAISRAENERTVGGDPIVMWLCACDCGSSSTVRARNLTSGNTTSCGCRKRTFIRANKTHGMSRSRTYAIWNTMVQRCTNPGSTSYESYGGRGITVCEDWKRFDSFYADMGEAPDGLSIDRVDNSKGYSPENCRWATGIEQGGNKRNNKIVFHNGQSKTLTEWAREYGLSPALVRNRFNALGWGIERCLTRHHISPP